MRDYVAALENIFWLSIWLPVRKLIFIVIVATYLMKQTRTIHSVDSELIYVALKLSYAKQYKI